MSTQDSDQSVVVSRALLDGVAYDLEHIARALAKNNHPAPCGADACVYCWAEGVATGQAEDIRRVLG